MKVSTWFALTMLIILSGCLAVSSHYSFKAGVPVWAVLSITILLLAAQIWAETLGGKGNKGAHEYHRFTRQDLIAVGWIVSILPMVYLFGLLATTALFSLVYLKAHGEKWLLSITFSIVFAAAIYGVFEVALEFSLYQGLLLSAL